MRRHWRAGTGKSIIKQAPWSTTTPSGLITLVVNRTLHTYHSVLRILCDSFQIDGHGRDVRCEKRLVEEAHRINHEGKMLAMVVADCPSHRLAGPASAALALR